MPISPIMSLLMPAARPGAGQHADLWLRYADLAGVTADAVVAIDSDYPIEEAASGDARVTILWNRKPTVESSSTSAHNACASISRGGILLAVHDDMFLPRPEVLSQICERMPTDRPAYLFLRDSNVPDVWYATIFCANRLWYEKVGYVYHPDFYHDLADIDVTLHAMSEGCLVDGRDIEILHIRRYLPDSLRQKEYDVNNNRGGGEALAHRILYGWSNEKENKTKDSHSDGAAKQGRS